MKLLAENELPISEIASHFPMSRTALSKQLGILAEAELVKGRKIGREKRYMLHPEALKELKDWLAYFDRIWNNKLSMLKFHVEKDQT